MKEKLLEKHIKKPLTDTIRKNIEKRLNQLRKDLSKLGQVVHYWNEDKNRLFVRTVNIDWLVEFTKDKRVIIWADVPFLLIPFVKPYKDRAVEILKEEIKELIK